MDLVGGRSAIVVPFTLPEALESIRLDHVSNARSGVPAHVTLLFPFLAAAAIRDVDLDLAATTIRATGAFDVEFRNVTSFPPDPTPEGVVWLAPEPPGPFIALTEALSTAFPGHSPYGGIHDTVIPHLTLANVDVDIERLSAAARPALPFRRRADAAVLLVEDDAGRWSIDRRWPLGGPLG
jgi:2'-5' RNA ligase